MTFLLFAVLIGLLPAAIAHHKGRSFAAWWLYGAAIFIVALPHALLAKADQQALDGRRFAAGEAKRCPRCAEVIRRQADVCRYCGADVAQVGPPERTAEAASEYLG